MGLKGDYAQMLAGLPIRLKQSNIAITQPSVKDICAMGEDSFFSSLVIFTKAKDLTAPEKDGNPRLRGMPDFQIIMQIIDRDAQVKTMVTSLFNLIFPDYFWNLDIGCFQFKAMKDGPNIGQLNPMNMQEFADVLGELFIPYGQKEKDYNPANDRAQQIAEKIKRGRQKLNELNQENGNAISLFGSQISTLSVGLNMDINTLYSYTPFQLYDSYFRYTKKLAYDIYQKVIMTPFMDASNMDTPDNWLDNIYKDQ